MMPKRVRKDMRQHAEKKAAMQVVITAAMTVRA
jgi:hypothetical protein